MTTNEFLDRFFQGRLDLASHFAYFIVIEMMSNMIFGLFFTLPFSLTLSVILCIFIGWYKERHIDDVYTAKDMTYNMAGMSVGVLFTLIIEFVDHFTPTII